MCIHMLHKRACSSSLRVEGGCLLASMASCEGDGNLNSIASIRRCEIANCHDTVWVLERQYHGSSLTRLPSCRMFSLELHQYLINARSIMAPTPTLSSGNHVSRSTTAPRRGCKSSFLSTIPMSTKSHGSHHLSKHLPCYDDGLWKGLLHRNGRTDRSSTK